MTQLALKQAANSGPNRDARGRLLPGHGMGRPAGTQNRRGRAEIERLHDRSEAVWRVIDARLAENCTKTALWLASRLVPETRVLELDSGDPGALTDAIIGGELTSAEAVRLANAIKNLREVAELGELREKLTEIENLLNAKGKA